MSGTASSSTATTTKPTIRRRGGHANPAQYIYWGLGIIAFFLIVGFIGSLIKKDKREANGSEFRMYLVNQDGSQTPIGKWYSMDSVSQVNSHLEYNYNDTTKGVTFTSKGPVDTYWPSKRKPGTFIHKHYCGKGVFNWSELKELCTLGTVKVFKSDDDDCD